MSAPFEDAEIWFVTGSVDMYGADSLRQVDEHAAAIVTALNGADDIPVQITAKPVVASRDAIRQVMLEANSAGDCIGVIAWMHTFSPAKMWIAGLSALHKPLMHLHTQFNQRLPWSEIDMDFMNLNQSAHGDREFGYMATRLGLNRKVVVGHWQDGDVQARVGTWARAAAAWHDSQHLKVARFGDNMREVAVTEGDKVEAQARFGYSVNGFGVGDLACAIARVSAAEIDRLVAEYDETYRMADSLRAGGDRRAALREAAAIELGMRSFLENGGFGAFTDTFQDLHGLEQLPGIAVQRLMADGYGFGAEGDWKTAALVRAMKVMAAGLKGGTSFMEDYTYDFGRPAKVLGAHMLEVCPSIAAGTPSCEIHPLSIGGKADPVRLVFTAPAGAAVNASMVQVGNRFRMIVNEVDVVTPDRDLPKLPVARAVWECRPNLATAATAWIYAGGAHHTGFSQSLTTEHLLDFADMADVEFLLIDKSTDVRQFRNELRWNAAAFR